MEKKEPLPLAEAGKNWRERRRTEAQWYIVEAVEGKDFRVYGELAAMGYECFRPVDRVIITRRVMVGGVLKPQKTERKIPRFGRYVFLHHVMSASVRSAIHDLPEVKRFVCLAGTEEPASIPDALIEFYRKGFEGEAKEIDREFSPTDKVRIAIGPATGVIGVVKGISGLAARFEPRDKACGPLVVPLAHLELVEKGVGRVAEAHKRKVAHA
ncbi:transcription termination/antitermination protein NusG [Methylocystis sp. SC2]|uniref:transcription termination/antitermination protein NusG n=1 Tax=Methylocystis sp. (strain SC2) TaxID=187303 RepID=UPI00027AF02C|nr:transcription termination/antitermination NusG family protein [Methylocystis sp. SC2]CCJ07084.1 Transcription termination/antitermination factor NusG [Methylocystis sp. SC2]